MDRCKLQLEMLNSSHILWDQKDNTIKHRFKIHSDFEGKSTSSELSLTFENGNEFAKTCDSILKEKPSFEQNCTRGFNSEKIWLDTKEINVGSNKWMSLPLPPPLKCVPKPHHHNIDELSIGPNDTITSEYEINDSFDDNECPIVLVEDYLLVPREKRNSISKDLCESDNMHQLLRKDSIATFREMHMHNEGIQDTFVQHFPYGKEPDLNLGILGLETTSGTIASHIDERNEKDNEFPGSEKLKHCDVCDRPLYEISSLLSHNNGMKVNMDTIVEDYTLYNEFICWECTEVYENIFNDICLKEIELDRLKSLDYDSTNESENNTLSKDSAEKLSKLFNEIHHKYIKSFGNIKDYLETSNSYRLLALIAQLWTAYGLNTGLNDNKLTTWYECIRYKMRWRWRIRGLLPTSLGTIDNKI